MSRRILVVNDYDGQYGPFWAQLGEVTREVKDFMRDPESFDLVCFTGGEDVSPELYGHQNLSSYNSIDRDKRETMIFEAAHKYEIPMTGICRGSQFLNVMCGGTMVQHLKRSHGGARHGCITVDAVDDRTFEVTSSHHQMSVLGPGGVLLAWAEQPLALNDLTYDGDSDQALSAAGNLNIQSTPYIHVTEAFAYPEAKIFAVQHHPEWQNAEEEAPQWTLQMIREICFEEQGMAATS